MYHHPNYLRRAYLAWALAEPSKFNLLAWIRWRLSKPR